MPDRLLIVDDDPGFTAFIAAVASATGYEVLEITVSTKFEAAITSWSPTHVMVDMNMPEIDGFEALKILKRRSSSAKVIICSAADRGFLDAVHRLGERLGLMMSGIIQKPVRPKDIKSFLERIAGGSEPTASAEHVFDRGSFDEVCSALGREWMVKGLRELIAQIETTFAEEGLASANREQLARGAHALVSYAGMLGFSEFSQLCREVEEAGNKDEEITTPLRRVQSATQAVCTKARELIIDLSDELRIEPDRVLPIRIGESLPAVLPD